MHTRSGLDASPYKDDSPGNINREAYARLDGLRRGWKRTAGGSMWPFTDESEPSSSTAADDIPVNKSLERMDPTKSKDCPEMMITKPPLGCSKTSKYLNYARNLIQNFAATTRNLGYLKTNVSSTHISFS